MRSCKALVFGLVLATASIGSAQGIPGVAVDSATVYAQNPSGEIQAIDIATGKILWQNASASWPVGFGGGKLVALTDSGQGNSLQVCLISSERGDTLAVLGPIQFAPWAKAKFAYESKSDFNIWIASQWAAGMVLYWRAERWSPITLQNYRQAQTQQVAMGRILVGFDNNSVEAHEIPPRGGAPKYPPADRSLPMLKGQKALYSVAVRNSTIALVRSGSDLTLQCFRQNMLQWSVPVGTKRR